MMKNTFFRVWRSESPHTQYNRVIEAHFNTREEAESFIKNHWSSKYEDYYKFEIESFESDHDCVCAHASVYGDPMFIITEDYMYVTFGICRKCNKRWKGYNGKSNIPNELMPNEIHIVYYNVRDKDRIFSSDERVILGKFKWEHDARNLYDELRYKPEYNDPVFSDTSVIRQGTIEVSVEEWANHKDEIFI